NCFAKKSTFLLVAWCPDTLDFPRMSRTPTRGTESSYRGEYTEKVHTNQVKKTHFSPTLKYTQISHNSAQAAE
ncbi:hypothetical protein LJC31_05580, partial [Synergistaceae bacterium OttesenSCG-928-I11]|nr:hypothetical protein [Synergistaceae bacterium OttesenSCG-928-I11]